MKVGKLQLHQGMFPQAMKNLRLVSVPKSHAVLSVGRPLPFDFYQLYTSVQTHALIHTHAHKCLKKNHWRVCQCLWYEHAHCHWF